MRSLRQAVPSLASVSRSSASTSSIRRCVVEADSVPLEQRELGLVPAAELVVAEHAADLIDVATAGREQALHRELGRRV